LSNPDNGRISYYLCGEYGSKTFRPHYHAIIFNSNAEDINKAWTLYKSSGATHLGFSTFDVVNENTIMYTAKYMNKGRLIPMYDGDDRLKEFQLFSKGLGLNYLTDAQKQWHKADISRLYTYVDGFKKALPRYFRLKIYDETQRAEQALLAQSGSEDTYRRQYADYQKHKAKNQTFEEYRYAAKKAALDYFRIKLQSRDKI